MKRFLVAIPTTDGGGVEVHPMKEWLRQNPSEVPPGSHPTTDTSHRLRDALRKAGWVVQENEHEVRLVRTTDSSTLSQISQVLGDESEDGEDTDDAGDPSFGLEYQLRDFLAQNIERFPIDGTTLKLYVDPTGRDGVEYPTDVGPIDILAVDPMDNFVVFELKRARVADRAVGQLARYMGWVKHTIGRDRNVKGVIVAKTIDKRLRYAATVVPCVTLLEYTVEFHLHPAHDIGT